MRRKGIGAANPGHFAKQPTPLAEVPQVPLDDGTDLSFQSEEDIYAAAAARDIPTEGRPLVDVFADLGLFNYREAEPRAFEGDMVHRSVLAAASSAQ